MRKPEPETPFRLTSLTISRMARSTGKRKKVVSFNTSFNSAAHEVGARSRSGRA
jgi:hypothetical protein